MSHNQVASINSQHQRPGAVFAPSVSIHRPPWAKDQAASVPATDEDNTILLKTGVDWTTHPCTHECLLMYPLSS